jgi:hypothetical protein
MEYDTGAGEAQSLKSRVFVTSGVGISTNIMRQKSGLLCVHKRNISTYIHSLCRKNNWLRAFWEEFLIWETERQLFAKLYLAVSNC